MTVNDPNIVAQALTSWLVERPNNYGGRPPLEERVRTEISRIATTLAQEVVSANPAIHDAIRIRIQGTIAAALRDDTYLSEVVAGAVAKALGQLVGERGDGE